MLVVAAVVVVVVVVVVAVLFATILSIRVVKEKVVCLRPVVVSPLGVADRIADGVRTGRGRHRENHICLVVFRLAQVQ